MSDIYMNQSTHDIELVNGVMRLTANNQELAAQRVSIRLSMFKGEWFANILEGIPYLRNDNNTTQILGKSTKEVVDIYLREGILSEPTIETLDIYTSTLDRSTGGLSVTFEAITTSGETLSVSDLPIII